MIEVITGPMFSGKTTEVLRRLERFARAGKSFLYLKPGLDTRVQPTKIKTVRGEIEVTPIYMDVLQVTPEIQKADIIVIDEAQFFSDLVWFCQLLRDSGKTVLVAGLDMNASRLPFGEMGELLAVADKVTKLTAICQCGKEAAFTKKVKGDIKKQVEIGDDPYKACCLNCFLEDKEDYYVA